MRRAEGHAPTIVRDAEPARIGGNMEIRIGVQNISREITLESDLSTDELTKVVAESLAGTVLELKNAKGGKVIVPAAAIGYVEIGTEEKRRVGFGG